MQLEQSSLVMFPVNDNSDLAHANGGSHWQVSLAHSTARGPTQRT